MKKIIFTFAAMLSVQACFAYQLEGDSADVSKLQNRGYSQAMLKVIDRNTEQVNGGASSDEVFVRYYKDYKPANGLAAFYTKFKIYFDPAQEDDFFGRHEMDMNNAWFPDLHDSTVQVNNQVESL